MRKLTPETAGSTDHCSGGGAVRTMPDRPFCADRRVDVRVFLRRAERRFRRHGARKLLRDGRLAARGALTVRRWGSARTALAWGCS